ncbi:hypothetical protein BIW11_03291 [Tropilaelaps mercedesae]|uniref:Uncharacterized protein n=1 Tax=Tropilaelaps mercedesae TaxID=418985 RepID=A0A1V9XP17_9ACAR|nr:hypothetical protein BIW11_03291 [Tropilaelaps mercedesae]
MKVRIRLVAPRDPMCSLSGCNFTMNSRRNSLTKERLIAVSAVSGDLI